MKITASAASTQIGKRGPAHTMTRRIGAAELLYGFADWSYLKEARPPKAL